MNAANLNMDPLNSYGYPYSSNYEHQNMRYPYNIKVEPYQNQIATNNESQQNVKPVNEQTIINKPPVTETYPQTNGCDSIAQPVSEIEKEDTKEHLKHLVLQKKSKSKGKVSSYWNKKVDDKEFPFYGCSICNISFKDIVELDNHVTVHKGRLTSYNLRLKNQKKRKLIKKEQKKMKKLGKKVKKEDAPLDIEIKPEDGYIGTETAVDYTANASGNNTDVGQLPQNNGNIVNSTDTQNNNDEENDPRLEKLFKCFSCQKQFALSYYLKLHVRSHTDERPYTCKECGMSFITASKLGRHNKRIHLSVRFTCRICYRCFSRFEYLTKHFDKKHPDDKLEGEPYDYNAILPYLKELEEQLREENEVKEKKPKTEDLWMDQPVDQPTDQPDPILEVSKDTETDSKEFNESPVKVTIEEMKSEDDVKKEEDVDPVKEETLQEFDNVNCEADAVYLQDDFQNDDNLSDEDYFPSNTWAATPKFEPPIAPPVKQKRKAKPKNTEMAVSYPHKCELCNKMIKSSYYMKIHLRIHSGEKPFECYCCGKRFITSSKMKRHLLTHEDYVKQKKLEQEIKEEADDGDTGSKGKVKAPKTKKKYKKSKPSKENEETTGSVRGFALREAFRKRPFACMYCHQRFLHRDTMAAHSKTHQGEDLKCYFCLSPMADETTLKAHEDTHKDPKPYVCNLCGRPYRKRDAMLTHRKTHDAATKETREKKEFICDVCSKSYNAYCKLQRHLVTHRTDRYVLRYECPVCAHMFNTRYHVQMHLNTHQKEGLILEENRGDILAMVMQNARKIPQAGDRDAAAAMPPDERSRVCNICGQVFQHFYYLEEHLKSHGSKIAIDDSTQNEEKKHICQVCNKGFKLHYYLKLHSYTHTKEKPFVCQQCGKGFITKGKLKRHIETHSGLKKYQCHVCYKFFTRPSYLRIHVRTIHGTQDYNFSRMKYGISEGSV